MNTIQAEDFLTLFITKKEQRQTFIDRVIESVQEGFLNPLDALIGLKGFAKITEALTDQKTETGKIFMSAVHDEYTRYGEKKFDYKFAKIEGKEVGVKYDYSDCGDPVLLELDEAAKKADKALKDRQEWLKTCPAKGLPVLIENTGEMATVYPPSKSSTSTVSVSL